MPAKAASAKAHGSLGDAKTQQETIDREQMLDGFEEAEMAAEALASGEWLLREEAGSGRPYYVHRATGSSVWDLREELARRARQEASVPVSEALAAGEWQVALDEETRSLYYFHPPTGTTCWELTEELVAANRVDAAPDTSQQDEGEEEVAGGGEAAAAAAAGAGDSKAEEAAAAAAAVAEVGEAVSPVSSLSASEGGGAEIDPLERPVFPEGLPGSERAAAVLDQGYWTWHVDEVGFRYYTEVASGRTVRDLRAEMAQVAAEERSAAVAMACEADELPEADDDDDAAAAASDAGSPPAPSSPPSSPKAVAAEADRLLRSPIPVNSPEWDMPANSGGGGGSDVPAVNDSLLLPSAAEAEAEPEAEEAAQEGAGMPAAGVPAVGPPPPDFEGMFQEARAPAGDGADTYARAGVLRGVSGALQAAQDEAGRAPRVVRAVPRRGESAYNARDKWGSVSYLDADTERQVDLVREHELRRARVRTDLDEMRARYEASARQLLPLPPPPRVTAAAVAAEAAAAVTPPRYRWDIGEARPFSPILPGSTVAMRLVNTPRPPTPLVLGTPQGMLSLEHLSV